MPIYISRSEFDKLDPMEQGRRIAEGCVVRDDNWEQQEIRAERVKAELAEWRADHEPKPLKRADFDAMTAAERAEHIRAGGIVTD